MPEITRWPVRLAARSLILEWLYQAESAAKRCADRSDPESLHDLRVALRHVRVLLRAYRPWLDGAVSRKRERRLRDLTRASGGARNLEVQREWLARVEAESEEERAAVAEAAQLLDGRQAQLGELDPLLRDFRRQRRRLRGELEALRVGRLGRMDEPGFAQATALLCARTLDDLQNSLQAVQAEHDPEGLHRARLAAKALRYLMEAVAAELPACARAARRLARLQDLLGGLNDAFTLEEELRRPTLEEKTEEGEPAAEPTADSPLLRRLAGERSQAITRLRADWLEPDFARRDLGRAIEALRAVGRAEPVGKKRPSRSKGAASRRRRKEGRGEEAMRPARKPRPAG